jgi:putative membrane protein
MIIKNLLILAVALLHFYFLILEMFLWTRPRGLRTFGMNLEKAKETAVLAANQGLYNGFLSAGLIWALVHPDKMIGNQLALFFLGCVIVAGSYGAYSSSIKILWIQALPAAIALGFCLMF